MRQPNNINIKIFEIILIVGFILGIASLFINFFLTLWLFTGSYYLFIIEIALLALNFICFIFSIILIIMGKNSSSFCICILILILIIINILCSIGENITFYFVYYYFKLFDKIVKFELEEKEDKELEKKYEKFEKIFSKIMKKNFDFEEALYGNEDDDNKDEEYNYYRYEYEDDYQNEDDEGRQYDDDYNDDDDEVSDKKAEKKIKILKILPWISINFNALIQILSLILIIILLKIIKTQNNSTQFGQASSLRNQFDNNQNFQALSNNNNLNNQEFQKKKTKNKIRGKKNNIISGKDSEQIGIARKKKNKNNRRKTGFKNRTHKKK